MTRRLLAALFIIYTICLHSFVSNARLEDDGQTAETFAFDPTNDTKFLLYTSKNLYEPQELALCDPESLMKSNFEPGNPVRIIIHGFRDGPNAIVNSRGRNGYAELGDFNVIVVDWSKGADTLNYMLAKQRIYKIGVVIAKFIECLLESYHDKLQLSDIYLIGHSLGAHLAGVTGKNMKSGKISAIYGLDPAGPLFSIDEPDKRIDKGDAEYVEIIHTDRGLQGLSEPMGTADFYPNFGLKQPGCGQDLDGACSHQRSAIYWAEALTSNVGFWSVPCDSYDDIKNKNCKLTMRGMIKMGGEPANKGQSKGIYYLETSDKSPFALGPV